jgi:hypothetical protein
MRVAVVLMCGYIVMHIVMHLLIFEVQKSSSVY